MQSAYGSLGNFWREPNPSIKWEKIIALLDEIRKEASQMGAQYVMVMHPSQLQVEEGLLQELKQAYHLDFNRYDFDGPNRVLANYCASKGVLCLDLLPSFRAIGSKGGLYAFRDSHYNQAGNALVANEIFHFLRDILPPGVDNQATLLKTSGKQGPLRDLPILDPPKKGVVS